MEGLFMSKILSHFIAAKRKRRRRALRFAVWILSILSVIEFADLQRYSDLLSNLYYLDDISLYRSIEEQYSDAEFALGFIEPAIEDLNFLYL
jgi:hypothetical protein